MRDTRGFIGACLASVLFWTASLTAPAWAQTGALDPDFAPGGERILAYTPTFADREDRAIAVLRDSSNRLLVLTSKVRDIAPEVGRDLDLLMYRLTPSGALDTSFGSGRGFVLREFAWSEFRTARFDSQGRILLVGTVVTQQGSPLASLSLARLLPDGSRDPNFNGGVGGSGSSGIFSFSLGSETANRSTAVTELGNGDLVLAGHLVPSGSNEDFFAIRLAAADGAPVLGWAVGGIALIDLQPGSVSLDRPVAVQALASGGVLLLGQSCTNALGCRPASARLGSSGALDSSYCASGACIATSVAGVQQGRQVLRDINVGGFDFATLTLRSALADGNGNAVLLAESTLNSGPGAAPALLVRLTPDGALDGTFGTGGRLALGLADAALLPNALVQDDQQRLVILGAAQREDGRQALAARLLAQGQPDPAFGPGGVRTYFGGPLGADRTLRAMQMDGSRMLLLGDRLGTATRDVLLLRTGGGLFSNGFE